MIKKKDGFSPVRSNDRLGGGVSVTALLTGTIPEPTHDLKWGENIPEHVMIALHNGETAILRDSNGNPYSLVLIDYFGTIREKRITPPSNH